MYISDPYETELKYVNRRFRQVFETPSIIEPMDAAAPKASSPPTCFKRTFERSKSSPHDSFSGSVISITIHCSNAKAAQVGESWVPSLPQSPRHRRMTHLLSMPCAGLIVNAAETVITEWLL